MFTKISRSARLAGVSALILAAALTLGAGQAPLSVGERAAIASTLRLPLDAGGESADAVLIERLRAHATKARGLRIVPSRIDDLWALAPAVGEPLAGFEEARAEGTLESWLAALEPSDGRYLALAKAAERYRLIVARGGWPLVTGTAVLRVGDTSPAVQTSRARLQAEGYELTETTAPTLFDAGLEQAVAAFQARHGLQNDGAIGPATRAALAVPADRRLAQLEANLERWRWLPRPLPADRIEVDIASQTAIVFAAGAPVLDMRVIVGSPRHHTPMFASRLDAVVFNPPWNVPASIARAEIAPKVARDPGYLARNRMVRTETGFRQLPGPGNALGRLKFDLVSPFGVYLHDTSSRSLFALPTRTLSHGCIRLEKPDALAAHLLGAQGWSAADVEAAIQAGATRRVDLQTPLPVFVVYRTAEADIEGWASFGPDPYGWDRRLIEALPTP